jgi:Tol biopolymer transport system component/tRNA A-37 threonylcarbamoyl transferase component Bud32
MNELLSRLQSALADRYRVERELGQGGMATVYLAEDLKHGRRVAIKVLRPELAAVIGAERFLREIKTIATLQHPHILGLIDSGEVNGTAYYVMPFVEGESLRDRLSREKHLPIGDAVRLATEMASALDYAHRHGVIHRDIKPENILLHDGQALVADFGIALAVSSAGGSRMTETGMSLGTPHYMSPEQAMGEREITARSDVYALGAVTYEMLTGDPPFTGSTAQAIVAKVMTEKPASIRRQRERVPEPVEDAVLTALEKLPADRFASAKEFAEALTNQTSRSSRLPARTSGSWLERHALPVVGALVVVALAAGLLALRGARTHASAEVSRFGLALGAGEGLAPVGGTRMIWSPDGRAFVYVGIGSGGGTQLWLRSLNALAATPIAGTDGASSPFISPDGQQVGFVTTTPFSVRVAPRAGGKATVIVADSLSGGGGDWSDDGWIYFDAGPNISRVRPDGTGREIVTALDSTRKEIGIAWPQALPGQRGVIFRVRRVGDATGDYGIFVQDLKTRTRKPLVKAAFARYAASGHLLYVLADGSLMAQRLDLDRLALVGEPVLIARGLGIGAFGAADLSIAPNGSLLYSTGRGITTAEPVWVGRDGASAAIDSSWHVFASGLALSPDGSRLALHLNAPSGGSTSRSEDIWVKQLPNGPMSRLTFEGEQNRRPSWSHDGRDILFLSSRSGPPTVFRQRADGGAPAKEVVATQTPFGEASESPDGRWLVLRSDLGTPGDGDILVVQIGVDTVPRPIVASAFQELAPAVSPDGRWLAYTSNETGQREVYVRPFPDVSAGKFQVSTAGGTAPRWSHRGDELFYRTLGDDFMAAQVRTTPTFTLLGQRRLFSAVGYTPGVEHATFEVSPDDRRFLMLRVGSTSGAKDETPQVVMVLNFFAELERVLP